MKKSMRNKIIIGLIILMLLLFYNLFFAKDINVESFSIYKIGSYIEDVTIDDIKAFGAFDEYSYITSVDEGISMYLMSVDVFISNNTNVGTHVYSVSLHDSMMSIIPTEIAFTTDNPFDNLYLPAYSEQFVQVDIPIFINAEVSQIVREEMQTLDYEFVDLTYSSELKHAEEYYANPTDSNIYAGLYKRYNVFHDDKKLALKFYTTNGATAVTNIDYTLDYELAFEAIVLRAIASTIFPSRGFIDDGAPEQLYITLFTIFYTSYLIIIVSYILNRFFKVKLFPKFFINVVSFYCIIQTIVILYISILFCLIYKDAGPEIYSYMLWTLMVAANVLILGRIKKANEQIEE